jgi:hypothetical protein
MNLAADIFKSFDIDNVSTLPWVLGRFSRLWCFTEDISHVSIKITIAIRNEFITKRGSWNGSFNYYICLAFKAYICKDHGKQCNYNFYLV